MNTKLPSGVISNPLSRKMIVTAALLALALITSLTAQDKHVACGGLHAAISGEVVRRDPLATQSSYVMLTFVLLNDSDAPINTAEESWQIVIDEKELKDSGLIFGNGLRPVGDGEF